MSFPLAYAQASGDSSSTLTVIVMAFAIVLGACLLAFIPIFTALSRKHQQSHPIAVISMFWGVAIAVITIWCMLQRLDWSKELTMRMQSGYYDPHDVSDAPTFPWIILMIAASAWVALLAWAMVGARLPMEQASSQIETP